MKSDSEQCDCFIGPNLESEIVFIVDQMKPPTFTQWDEHKVIIGAANEKKAREIYLRNYEPGWGGLGNITPMTLDQFKAWLDHGDTGSRVAEQVSRYSRAAAPGQHGLFKEDEHPRGQPENAGQFAPKGSAQHAPEQKTETTQEAPRQPAPGQRDFFGGVEPAAKPAEKPRVEEAPAAKQETMWGHLNENPDQGHLFESDKAEDQRELQKKINDVFYKNLKARAKANVKARNDAKQVEADEKKKAEQAAIDETFKPSGEDFGANPTIDFGDLVKTPEGIIGIMQGSGPMGSKRVKVVDKEGNKSWEDRETLTLLRRNGKAKEKYFLASQLQSTFLTTPQEKQDQFWNTSENGVIVEADGNKLVKYSRRNGNVSVEYLST